MASGAVPAVELRATLRRSDGDVVRHGGPEGHRGDVEAGTGVQQHPDDPGRPLVRRGLELEPVLQVELRRGPRHLDRAGVRRLGQKRAQGDHQLGAEVVERGQHLRCELAPAHAGLEPTQQDHVAARPRRAGHQEETIFLVGTPQCVLAEGLADLGIEVLLGDDRHEIVRDHLRRHGVTFDAEAVEAVAEFGEMSSRVRGNLGLLPHEDSANPDDVIAYAEPWLLVDRVRAEKAVAFQTDPTWRAYISCYIEGVRLCRDFVGGDPARFERLLSEQFLPADLVA